MLLARLGLPVSESHAKLHGIDTPSTNRTRWQWHDIKHGKHNLIYCSCHGGSVHKHYGELHQILDHNVCDHVRALYSGRVTLDKGAQQGSVRTAYDINRQSSHTIYRVIFTPRGEELFSWRIAALALLKE